MGTDAPAGNLATKVKQLAVLAAFLWTLVNAGALYWNFKLIDGHIIALARNNALASFDRDLLFRRWNAGHGGVYVPVTDKTSPNPYLTDVPNRDIVTTGGVKLTLINPAYMTRQAHELASDSQGTQGHITSLKPIRPENMADEWEKGALTAFEGGAKEVFSLEIFQGQEYMRFMRPLKTEERCLKCHAHQGYKVGDIRGGISVSIPMAEYNSAQKYQKRGIVVAHGILWTLGLALLGFGGTYLCKRIKEREEAEKNLLEKTGELDQFFALSLDMLCIVDEYGRFKRVNDAWLKNLGYPREEFLGKRFMEFVHPDDVDGTSKAALELARGQAVYDFTNRYRTRGGDYRWVEWRSAPGNAGHIYAAARDVTDRIAMETALKASEERLRNLIDSAPMGIHLYGLNAEGRLVLLGYNKAAEKITGVDNGLRYLGKTIEEAFPSMVGTPVLADYYRICRERVSGSYEMDYADDNFKGTFEIYAFPTSRDAIGVIFMDITDKRKAEQQKELLEEQFRQAQKMEAVGKLAGGVAHDFNNLLMVILGYCEMLKDKPEAMEVLGEEISAISSAGERAASLTRQLLAFSRKQVLNPKVIRLSDVVIDIQKMLGRLLGEDIELSIRLSGDAGFIKADPGQLNQVVMNLAVNARDAMPRGGKLTLETANVEWDQSYVDGHRKAVKPGSYVMLAVTDNGMGMDAVTKERLFEPFFTTKGVGKGTGLGLATVHGIVNQSGGHIWVYSEPGKGTTFKIYFPRVEPDKSAEEGETPREEPPTGTETVLLVEDSPDVRRFIHKSLSELGYKVLEAADGSAALAVANSGEHSIDLVITDMVMPGINGRELADALAKIIPGAKTIFMSGYTENTIMNNSSEGDDFIFIQKPFRIYDLAKRAREVLDG